jgi:hypothetical protein
VFGMCLHDRELVGSVAPPISTVKFAHPLCDAAKL